jgi:hypothetical protein
MAANHKLLVQPAEVVQQPFLNHVYFLHKNKNFKLTNQIKLDHLPFTVNMALSA